jgi:transposase-like protein
MTFKQYFTEQSLSKGMSLEDIAKKHGIDIAELQKELEKGAKVEHEHTSSEEHAKRVAMDHLVEDPKYYTKLSKAGL